MLNTPQPLMIFERRQKRGDDAVEIIRFRPETTDEFVSFLTAGISACVPGNPDEIIMRLLRPVRE